MRWNITVVLIFISLRIRDVDWALFHCPLAICISSLEKCLFNPFAQFLFGLFLLLSFRVLYIIRILTPKVMIWKYSLPFCMLPFHNTDCVFWCTDILSLVSGLIPASLNELESITSSSLSWKSLWQTDVNSHLNIWAFLYGNFFFFWPHLRHAEIPRPGMEPVPQSWPWWILNVLGHRELQHFFLFKLLISSLRLL